MKLIGAQGIMSGLSVLLAIAKPLLKLTDQSAEYARLHSEYTSAFSQMKILVEDVQVDRELTTARRKRFEELRQKEAGLSKEGDPLPKRLVVERIKAEVDQEIIITALWVPVVTKLEFDRNNKAEFETTGRQTSIPAPNQHYKRGQHDVVG